MKKIFCLKLALIYFISGFSQSYDGSYLQVTFSKDYNTFLLNRQDKRVKAKFFASNSGTESVYERYENWKHGKNIILISSFTYMDICDLGNDNILNITPIGLTIENGVVINNNLSEMDGLVLVYPDGELAVSNLDSGNIYIEGITRKLDIRNNAFERSTYIEWARKKNATVLQTHLLIFHNSLTIFKPDDCSSCKEYRERRFLGVCKDENGNLFHVIIHMPYHTTLYDGTKNAYNYLIEQKGMKEILFLVNMDPSCYDVFEYYNPDGTKNDLIHGKWDIKDATNFIVYYFE